MARYRGGDGVIRELEALAPLSYSLITERRRHAPPGAHGGEPGATGRNLIDGEELPRNRAESSRPANGCASKPPVGVDMAAYPILSATNDILDFAATFGDFENLAYNPDVSCCSGSHGLEQRVRAQD